MCFLTSSTLNLYYDLCHLLIQDIKTSHSLVFHKSFVAEIIMAFRVKFRLHLVGCKIFSECKIFSSVWLHSKKCFGKYFQVFGCVPENNIENTFSTCFSHFLTFSQLPNKYIIPFFNR